jgi:predicted acyltransferase (DUF342 family)
MTISSANLVANTNTFGDWLIKTNVLVDALTNDIVTLSPNDNQGNVVVNGSIQSETLYVDTLSGGAIGAADVVTISSNATFQKTTTIANTIFSGANVSLGLAANVQIKGANSTHSVLIANNTTNKLDFKFVPNFDTSVVTPSNNSLMVYDAPSNSYRSAEISIVGDDLTVSGNLTTTNLSIDNNANITGNIIIVGGLIANGTFGTNNQLLSSDGSSVYWSDLNLSTLGIENHDTINVTANADITANNISANSISANTITGGTTDTLIIKDSTGSVLKTIRGV